MERKLASIQKIESLTPIKGADRIELAQILGWHTIVKKGEFEVGDLCIYFEIDSVLPKHPIFDFMEKYKYRVRTIKMKGVLSQGLAIPITNLPKLLKPNPGLDVTGLLGVTKYEPPQNNNGSIRGITKGKFPMFVPKTDEPRIQNIPYILERYKGEKFQITEKVDGCSSTFYYHEDNFGVCSRNLELRESDNNIHWKIARRYELEYNLKRYDSIAIQGEIIGPGIQSNRYKLDDIDLYVFNVWDIEERRYMLDFEVKSILTEIGLKSVPIWCESYTMMGDVDYIVGLTKGKSQINSDIDREGLVFRHKEGKYDPNIGRVSFKAINPNYLLKYEKEI